MIPKPSMLMKITAISDGAAHRDGVDASRGAVSDMGGVVKPGDLSRQGSRTHSHRLFARLQVRQRTVFDEELREEGVPVRIVALDQVDLPLALVLFQPLLAVDRSLDAVVPLVPDEPLDAVLFGEPVHRTVAMLEGAAR